MTPEANLERLLDDFLRLGIPGCALTVCHKGKEIFSCEKGYSDVAAKRPFRRSDTIRLFSNSKVFTAVTLLTLLERGKFLLYEPLSKYLPEFRDIRVGCLAGNNSWVTREPTTQLCIRDCLTMSTGFPYDVAVNDQPTSFTGAALRDALHALYSKGSFTCRDFARALAQVPLLFDPGTSFMYGYSLDLAGALIEVLADRELGDYMKKAVLEPLGLEHTGFWSQSELAGQLVPAYDPSGTVIDALEGPLQNVRMFPSGGGGLLSTLDDLSRFGCALSMGGTLAGGRVLGRKTIDLMRQNHLNGEQMLALNQVKQYGWPFLNGYGYGLGVWTYQNPREGGLNSSIGQFGWNGAAGTCLFVDPEEQLSIAYAQQVLPNAFGNECQPRLVNAAYALL